MDGSPPAVRQAEWLVAPLAALGALLVFLLAARFYDRLPATPPSCGFKATLGVPCLGCGGTRAMRALAQGEWVAALRFNPAVPGFALVALAWTGIATRRYLRATPRPEAAEQDRRLRRNALVTAVLLVLDWIYLLLFLP